jgi:NAD(P)H-dependent flavin oxidoreductase YrpB (nitropropane dioxygenase family)
VIDVLDHVLDKGIVIDAWVRVSVAGIDLLTVEARIVVASIHTYVAWANAVSQQEPVARPAKLGVARPTLEDQLQRVREHMDWHDEAPHLQRRSEDRLREERHDARARTVTRARTRRPAH